MKIKAVIIFSQFNSPLTINGERECGKILEDLGYGGVFLDVVKGMYKENRVVAKLRGA